MAQAKFLPCGKRVMMVVRIKPYPQITKTFELPPGFKRYKDKAGNERVPAEATEWAKAEEEARRKRTASMPGGVKDTPIGQAIDTFLEEREKTKAVGRSQRVTMLAMKRLLPKRTLGTLTQGDVRDMVLGLGVTGGTMCKYLGDLTALYRWWDARHDLGVPSPCAGLRAKLEALGHRMSSRERDRRPTEEELETLKMYFGSQRADAKRPWADLIDFSIATTMRQSEVTNLRWSDYDPEASTILIRDRKDPKRKAGNHQIVPLLDDAREILERQPRTDDPRIFPFQARAISADFSAATRLLGIEDLHWHDLRHEGISRLFERGFDVPVVAVFSGHKSWNMLRRYTQLRADKIIDLAGRNEAASAFFDRLRDAANDPSQGHSEALHQALICYLGEGRLVSAVA